MVDWPGLLKWSTKLHHDGTDIAKIQPMSEENKQWLTEAMESYAFDEQKRIRSILDYIHDNSSQITQDQQIRDNIFVLVDELEELIQGLSNPIFFCQTGGVSVLLNLIVHDLQQDDSQFQEIRQICCSILSQIAQNNNDTQEIMLDSNVFQIMNQFYKETNVINKNSIISLISALVRGTHLNSKRVFIQIEGLQFIQQNFRDFDDYRMKQKLLNLVYDLVYYDNDLDKTYYDLTPFMNTNSKKFTKYIQKKNKITLDEQKLNSFNNYEDSNQQFKGCVCKFLKDLQFINHELIKLLDHKDNKYLDIRIFIIQILIRLIEYSFNIYQNLNQQDLKDYFKKHLQTVQQLDKDNEGLNELELIETKKILNMI